MHPETSFPTNILRYHYMSFPGLQNSMSPHRWQRAKELFDAAAELTPPERADFLARETAGDSAMFDEVRRLLEFHDRQDAALDRPPVSSSLLTGSLKPQLFHEGELIAGGRFRIVRLLGEGGMGQVYEAEDLGLAARVALKTLKPHLLDEPKLDERFRQEVQLARQVAHPNVCRVFDFGQREGSPAAPFFTMELLEGETLSRRLERTGPLSFTAAAPLIRQMCAALDAAHAAGVIHRDFKSGNIFLVPLQQQQQSPGEEERLVVTDFGLSRAYTGESVGVTSAGTALGTPAYMAPEQIEGRNVGPAADVYALGVVMYEMATGQQPFTGPTPLAVIARKLKDDPPSPAKVAPGLDSRWNAAILGCLAREPQDRFQSASEVAAALGIDTGSSSVGTNSHASSVRWRRGAQRRKRMIRWGVIAAAAALAGVAGWWELLRPRAHRPTPAAARWYEQGVQALAGNATVTASRVLEQAVQADPAFALARARLAGAYAELDMPGKAKDELLRIGRESRMPKLDQLRIEAARYNLTREFAKAAAALAEIRRKSPSPADQLLASVDLAQALERSGRRKEALEALREAIALDPQNPTPHLHAGILEFRAGRPEPARAALREAERLFGLRGLDEGVSESILQRAFVDAADRKFDDSAANARRVVDRARALGHPWHLARAQFHLAGIESERGNLAAARELIASGVTQAGDERMPGVVSMGLNDLGFTLIAQSRLKEAEDTFRESMAIARRAGNEDSEVKATVQLAQTLIRAGRIQEGMNSLAPALAILRKNPGPALPAALAIRTNALIDLGQPNDAMASAQELLAVSNARADREGALRARERIDHIRGAWGDYPSVLESEKQRIAEYRAQNQQTRALSTLISMAHREAILGRKAGSDQHFAEASRLAESLGDAGIRPRLRILEVRAALAQLTGQPKQAAALAQRAIDLTAAQAKGTPTMGLAIAAAYARCPETGPARLTALAIEARKNQPAGAFESEIALAKCLARWKRWHDAVGPAQRAYELSAKSGDALETLEALRVLAAVETQSAQPAEAARHRAEYAARFQEFTKTWSEADKQSFARHPEISQFQ